jgi:hypothetical protein
MSLSPAARSAIVQEIVLPVDCVEDPSPLWQKALTAGISFGSGLIGVAGSILFAVTTAPPNNCHNFSASRLTALIEAGKNDVIEALPAAIAILGGQFTVGKNADGEKTMVYVVGPPLTNHSGTRVVAAALIAELVKNSTAQDLPEVVARGAEAVLRQALNDKDPDARREAEQAFVVVVSKVRELFGAPASQVPLDDEAKPARWPWVLIGGGALTALLILIRGLTRRDTLKPGARHAELHD